MTLERTQEYLQGLINEFLKLPCETEWIEFKKIIRIQMNLENISPPFQIQQLCAARRTLI